MLNSYGLNDVPSPVSDIERLGDQYIFGFGNDPRSEPRTLDVPSHQGAQTNAFRGKQLLESPQPFGIESQPHALTAGHVAVSSPFSTLTPSASPYPLEWALLETPSPLSTTIQRLNASPSNVDTLQFVTPPTSSGCSQLSTTSSPASVAPQLICDFCKVSQSNVDSLW